MTEHFRISITAVLVLGLTACGPRSEVGAGSMPAKEPGWSTHHDPAGFSVQLPPGWRVLSNRIGDLAISDVEGGSLALIRARPLRNAQGDLADWLRQDYPRSEPGMRELRIEDTQASSNDVVRAALSYTNPQGVARAAQLVVVRRGNMATLFIASAATGALGRNLPTIARVLDSLRFEAPTANAAAATEAQPSYAPWIDPRESAFMLELPAGWRTEGGLQRTTWNRRWVVQSTSPDGSTMLFLGDPNIPRMFILPNEITNQFGSGGMNQNWEPDAQIIAAFQSAEQFGAWLVGQRFGGEATGARARPDLVQIISRNPLLRSAPSGITAADVDFRLRDGRTGVLTLATYGTITPGVGGNWWVDYVHGFIASPQQVPEAGGALAHMIGTFQVNPNWATDERAHEGTLGQIYNDYLAYSRSLQQQTIEQRWASDAAIQRGRRDVLGGTVRLQDPQTGEVFETVARDRYYFRVADADRPTAVGSDADFKPLPQLDLRRLLQVGADVPDR